MPFKRRSDVVLLVIALLVIVDSLVVLGAVLFAPAEQVATVVTVVSALSVPTIPSLLAYLRADEAVHTTRRVEEKVNGMTQPPERKIL